MSQPRDFYEVLGLERSADVNAIRKAYKKLALKHHPDRNEGSEEAAALFKEATEAYTVLSDDQKRQRYDQFGHAGLGGAPDFGGDIFSHVQDIFSDVFGSEFFGGGGGGGRRQAGPARGRDMRVEQELTFEEAALGCKKSIEITSPVACNVCEGSGAEPGSQPQRCDTCRGQGQVSTGRGFIMFTQTCPTCRGSGETVGEPCQNCDGEGYEQRDRSVTVTFPAGIDEGHRLRVGGQGIPGQRGGPPGHLYVDVSLAKHERFEREGNDLITRCTVSFPDAVFGSKLTVELLDGTEHTVKVAAGTQPGTVLSARGKGVPNVNGRGRGALHVVVQIDVPKRVSRRAKKLLHDLANEL